jgi:hypothetical protein
MTHTCGDFWIICGRSLCLLTDSQDRKESCPSFGNVAGKYFLQQSSWPYNTSNKAVTTYYLFHHHGDAFMTVYSEMPQNLTVAHEPVILSGLGIFNVTADNGSLIALTLNNEILAVAEGTGAPVSLSIPIVTPGETVKLTITKQNYYRYSADLQVIPPTGAYIIFESAVVNDSSYGFTQAIIPGTDSLNIMRVHIYVSLLKILVQLMDKI